MSDTAQTPVVQFQYRDRLKTADGSSLELYGGSAPFIWTLEVYLEKEIGESAIYWFITLHIVAQGISQQVFRSATVEIVPEQVSYIPFARPGDINPVIQSSDFGVQVCTSHSWDEQTIVPKAIGVQLFTPHDASPYVNIVHTEVDTYWLIGARHIVLTDPPLRTANKSSN